MQRLLFSRACAILLGAKIQDHKKWVKTSLDRSAQWELTPSRLTRAQALSRSTQMEYEYSYTAVHGAIMQLHCFYMVYEYSYTVIKRRKYSYTARGSPSTREALQQMEKKSTGRGAHCCPSSRSALKRSSPIAAASSRSTGAHPASRSCWRVDMIG